MQETKELNALFTLIDDPDELVYSSVTERLVAYGKPVIPNLEHLWETTPNQAVQERIEMIIHRLHFTDLQQDLTEWKNSSCPDLLFGALLVAKFQYPELQTTPVIQDIEKIRRNVWLELNSFLTPLEQANVLSSIIYNYYHLKGIELKYDNPDEFFIHKVLESKKGNAIANSIIYQILCEKLEINARLIQIPKQSLIAFYHSDTDFVDTTQYYRDQIHFFVDATNGQAYSHNDIETYLNRLGKTAEPNYFTPRTNRAIISKLIKELSRCFNNAENQYKQEELIQLANVLDE
ncbi:transglutaminase family protein [Sediminibacterium sp. C3]|uniref:transglutaminase family protein n=1 Tax=Sediminibacterium sp. C3 TaxID=1267211 RepID=UPI0004055FBB|nr:transglutaminase family protein [Sediminibacterium sp. C3]